MTALNKQALREAANAANIASWGKWESYKPHKGARGYEVKVGAKAAAQHCLKVDAAFIATANPQTVLALLDELEASQKSNEFLKEQLSQLANFNPDWDKLEAVTDSLREHMAKLSAAEKRIADQHGIILSARNFISEYAQNGDVGATEFVKILDRAAGIGVKGE
ncbi:ead/Ea22-like family protein [Citrobacter pasteurii]|uniref:Ead/Ea22-like family protein n=1 Tax=Citrobacter pasteurii TaxID=1563222 RepID=A0A6N6K9F3_9ENTR|nr:ead/Ea22-like family protein [Citrobacter pasteurii]KAA1280216.1 ead/Ea22-like family protein [Citrobacter pasteurii]